jgi:hypothetical protein
VRPRSSLLVAGIVLGGCGGGGGAGRGDAGGASGGAGGGSAIFDGGSAAFDGGSDKPKDPTYDATICGEDAGSAMPDAIAGATWIDSIAYDPRSQIADIADVGQDAFVAAYVHVSFVPQHVAFDATGALLQQPAVYPGGGHALWLRANSSPSWRVGGCDTNYFAIEVRDAVRLETHARCGGAEISVTETVVDVIDVFSRPSLATRGTPQDGALLVVYGKGSQVVGRLLRFRDGAPESQFGPPFAIMEVPSNRAVFSTDVIYNQHSERFIVGEIDRYAEQGCQIRNALVAVDADLSVMVEREKVFGICDSGSGGHHPAVAYNPRGDGTYLWWRQDGNYQKAIYIHDAWGELTAIPPLVTGDPFTKPQVGDPQTGYHRYTVPIASAGDGPVQYGFVKSTEARADGKPSAATYGYAIGATPPWSWIADLPRLTGQVAVRVVAGRIFGLLYGDPVTGDCRSTDLFLASSALTYTPGP